VELVVTFSVVYHLKNKIWWPDFKTGKIKYSLFCTNKLHMG